MRNEEDPLRTLGDEQEGRRRAENWGSEKLLHRRMGRPGPPPAPHNLAASRFPAAGDQRPSGAPGLGTRVRTEA